MIGVVADLLILGLSVFIIIRGVKSGFIKSVMRLVRGFVAFIAAYAFAPLLGGFINSRFILPSMSGSIAGTIRSLVEKSDGVRAVVDLFTEMPDAVKQITDRYGVTPETVTEAVASSPSKEAAINRAAETIAGGVSGVISNCIAFVIIFVAVFIALVILTVILDSVFHLPVLKTANKVFGTVFAIIEALLIAYVISNLFGAGVRALEPVNPAVFGQKVIDKTLIVRFFTKYDLFQMLVNVFRA